MATYLQSGPLALLVQAPGEFDLSHKEPARTLTTNREKQRRRSGSVKDHDGGVIGLWVCELALGFAPFHPSESNFQQS